MLGNFFNKIRNKKNKVFVEIKNLIFHFTLFENTQTGFNLITFPRKGIYLGLQ